MSQLRKDPIIGRWVIISEERSQRWQQPPVIAPTQAEPECPFCRGKEHLTLPATFALNDANGNWRVRIISSQHPFLETTLKNGKKAAALMI